MVMLTPPARLLRIFILPEPPICFSLTLCSFSYLFHFLKPSAPSTGNKGLSFSRLTFLGDPDYKPLSANFIIGLKVAIPARSGLRSNQPLCNSECPVTALSLMLMAAVGVTRQGSGVRSEGWELWETRVYTGKRVDADGENRERY